MKYNTGWKSKREEGERYNIKEARQQQLGFMLNLIGMGASQMGQTGDIKLCSPIINSGVLACRLQRVTSPDVTASNTEI
jgi:hypothetical protein